MGAKLISSNDFSQLRDLPPTNDSRVLEFISSRSLPVFVTDDDVLYYKDLMHDMSFKRSIQLLVQMIRARTGEHVDTRCVDEATFESFSEAKQGAEPSKKSADIIDIPTSGGNQKVDDLLNAMIERNASDLHIKLLREEGEATVKMRVNGELVEYAKYAFSIGDALVRSMWRSYHVGTRKESSTNNGSFYYTHKENNNKQYMVRMTESPEVRGLMFVARMRDPHEIRELDETGYNEQQNRVIKNLLGYRKGLCAICGPTNSGKSSTQSTMLAMLPHTMHIIEIGDPVETHQAHIAHFELSENYGGGEAAGGGKDKHLEALLGATVRQDPDILALTEMRDQLTAKAALQLSSQGKFVITTMHTTDFVACFERFIRMGMTPADVVAPGFLRGLVCQKLIPKLCSCSVESSPVNGDTAKYAYLLADKQGSIRYRRAGGCAKCHQTGIVSRVLVAEAVEITNELYPIMRSIMLESNPNPYFEYAKAHSILNTHQHARERILAGEIDPSIAERELGRFSPDNLLWFYPNKGAAK